MKEGLIEEGSPAWQAMSAADQTKRKRAAAEARTKLKSPNFFVSRTRLCLRNLPHQISEKALKDLVVTAVSPLICNWLSYLSCPSQLLVCNASYLSGAPYAGLGMWRLRYMKPLQIVQACQAGNAPHCLASIRLLQGCQTGLVLLVCR